MSRFSGKCDLSDSYEIGDWEHTGWPNIHYGESLVPLRVDSYKDIVPYLPFIIGISTGSEIWIGTKSYIDEEEEELLKYKLNEAKRIYRKNKRNHEVFDIDKVSSSIHWFNSEQDLNCIKRLVEEVASKGDKAEIPNECHLWISDYYRKLWYDEMIKVGYTEHQSGVWVYGWRRWYDEFHNDMKFEENEKTNLQY